MIYEPILASLLYTDSYVVCFSLPFLATYWGNPPVPPPPVPTAMIYLYMMTPHVGVNATKPFKKCSCERLRRVGLVVSASASHVVGGGFAPRSGHTKYHYNKSAKWHCGRHTLICKKY